MPKYRVKVSRLVLKEDIVVIEASSRAELEKYLDEVEHDSNTDIIGKAGRSDKPNVVLAKGENPSLFAERGRHDRLH